MNKNRSGWNDNLTGISKQDQAQLKALHLNRDRFSHVLGFLKTEVYSIDKAIARIRGKNEL